MVNTPSTKRRARLAAVLFGGTHATKAPHERDRLDVLVQQLLDEDVEALGAIAGAAGAGSGRESIVNLLHFSEAGDLWYPSPVRRRRIDAIPPDSAPITGVTIAALSSFGCIDSVQGTFFGGSEEPGPTPPPSEWYPFRPTFLTALGRFVIEQLAREPIASGARATSP
jgi:hypothetical protein